MEKEFDMSLELRKSDFQSKELVKEIVIQESSDDTVSKAALFSYLMS